MNKVSSYCATSISYSKVSNMSKFSGCDTVDNTFGNSFCPKKWIYLPIVKELIGQSGSNFHRKLLAISCMIRCQTFCFRVRSNE